MNETRTSKVESLLHFLLLLAPIAYLGLLWKLNEGSRVVLRLWSADSPPEEYETFIVLCLAFVAGMLLALAVGSVGAIRRLTTSRRLRRRIDALEAEVARLRNLPVEPAATRVATD